MVGVRNDLGPRGALAVPGGDGVIDPGFELILHAGATRAIEVHPGDSERALDELRAAGVEVVD